MKDFLIRADDLGYSEGVNLGIGKAVSNGLVKSVGVMVNMPSTFHGLDLLKDYDVYLGQHTNICLGKPILDPKLIPSLCQNNGEFHTSKTYREAYRKGEDFVNLDEAVLEIEAQYHQFVYLTGEKPSYFEGHAIASPNFFKALEIVANKYDLPYLPMPTGEESISFGKAEIQLSIPKNFEVYENNPFSIIENTVMNSRKGICHMLVFHPGYIDAYLLRNSSMTTVRALEVEMLCHPDTRTYLEENNIRLITFDDLIKS
ncbi:ChbG/HpnK family deacetylase [Streptococcus moroccensis]|uniref:Glycoside hydrolase/deacetylase ChbG (UPF0249 family) n=1 Tax=Streptococcus moroccensis TaxID=1451356 RepID=A0ABT9YT90_9STRE|nr:ChbG/HpnK family deacetylase [Streptococcus moroccensis]MDQ0223211.1 putative glycoside hydrolase/deacetylase ChbG (UPF0249 family) [Streptococcus moroccensis]